MSATSLEFERGAQVISSRHATRPARSRHSCSPGCADNFVFDKNFEEAIDASERLLKRHGQKRFRGQPWGLFALE